MSSPQTHEGPATWGKVDRAGIKHLQGHSNPIEAVLSALQRVKATGPGTWIASCPTANHRRGDLSRGLSIREGDDGRVLIHCNAGMCAVDEIVDSIGLRLQDLFPPNREFDYPHTLPRGALLGRPRFRRIPWADLWESLEVDLFACSIAFSRLAKGQHFTPEDAASVAKLAGRLASKISEVRHGRG